MGGGADGRKGELMIYELLKRGQSNAIPTAELVKLSGCKSARDLQEVIAREREAGHLILSSCRRGGGYYLPAPGAEGRAEIQAFISTLRSRALNTLRILRDAKRALAELEDQQRIDGVG